MKSSGFMSWLGRLLPPALRPAPTCAEVMEVLQAYLDGEVDAATAARVAKHLDRCVACEGEAGAYRALADRLAAQAAPIDPDILGALDRYGRALIDPD